MKRILSYFLVSAIVMVFTGSLLFAQGWVQKTDMPGAGRFWNAVFRINNIIYTGTGKTSFSGSVTEDIWAYDTQTDTWEQVANYGAGTREGADGFGNGQRGFIAFGTSFISFTKTVYEYLPTSNTWVQKAEVPGTGFAYSHGFTIGNKYYIGPENGTQKVYAYNLDLNTWAEVAPFPGADRRAQVAFSANGKGYLGLGAGVFGGVRSDFYKYDPVANSWNGIASMEKASDQSCATSIGNIGYVFNVGANLKQLYRYDDAINEWIEVSTFNGDRMANSAFIGLNSSAYLVLGQRTNSGGNISSKQIWSFTPVPVAIKKNRAKEIEFRMVNNGYFKVKGYNLGQAQTTVKIMAINGSLEREINIPSDREEYQFEMPKTSALHLLTLIIDGERIKTEKVFF